jgi:hypothetical protein
MKRRRKKGRRKEGKKGGRRKGRREKEVEGGKNEGWREGGQRKKRRKRKGRREGGGKEGRTGVFLFRRKKYTWTSIDKEFSISGSMSSVFTGFSFGTVSGPTRVVRPATPPLI